MIENDEEIIDNIEVDPKNKELKNALSIIDQFHTRPLKRLEYELKASLQLKGHAHLLWRRALFRSISKYIIWEIEYSLKDDSFIIFSFYGLQGLGKSTLIFAIALLQVKITEEIVNITPKVWLCWSLDEVTKTIDKAHEYDIIILDEQEETSGEDSKIIQAQAYIISKTIRGKHISLYFVSIRLKGYEKVSYFVLQALEKNTEKEMGKVMILSNELLPLGIANISVKPFLRNTELREYYKQRKKEFLNSVQQRRGFSLTELDEERIQDDLTKINDKALSIFGDLPKSEWKKTFIKTIIRLTGIPGSKNYLENLTNLLFLDVIKEKVNSKSNLRKNSEFEEEEDHKIKAKGDFNSYFFEEAKKALLTTGIFPSPEKAQRYLLYYLSGKKITWEEVSEINHENELADSIRKYVAARRKKATHVLASVLEASITAFLNQQILSEPSSSDPPIKF